jgi:hypothetical protein
MLASTSELKLRKTPTIGVADNPDLSLDTRPNVCPFARRHIQRGLIYANTSVNISNLWLVYRALPRRLKHLKATKTALGHLAFQ